MSCQSPPLARQRRWSQECWTVVRKRRIPSDISARQSLQEQLRAEISERQSLQEELRAEISARQSLQDFTEMLAGKVMELENMQIRRMVGENTQIEAQLSRKKTVSMHGSSEPSRMSTEITTETESRARAG